MKEFRFRIIMIVAAIALAIYLLYPTYQDYQYGQDIAETLESTKDSLLNANPDISAEYLEMVLTSMEDSIKLSDPEIRDAREKRVKLGLDLQGGMRVVLEVNTGKLLEKLANNPDDTFREMLTASIEESNQTDEAIVDILVRKLQETNIRISRYFGSIRDDEGDIISDLQAQADDAVNRAREIISNRVNQYGVSEPVIQRQGERRIIVELPGVANEEEARRLLQGTALLEFKIAKEAEFTVQIMQRIDDVLSGKSLADSTSQDSLNQDVDTENVAETDTEEDTLAADTSGLDDIATEETTEEQFAKEHPFFTIVHIDPQSPYADGFVKESDRAKVERMLAREDVKKVIPNNVEFVFSAKPWGFVEGESWYKLYLINKKAELTGGVITDAQATIDPMTSTPIVTMAMNSQGATEWARITGANINKRCAIVLDGVVYSAPNINSKISGGRSQIEGMADLNEAKILEIVLKAGALPAPVDIIEERTVGPSLGQDSISQGFSSAFFGFLIVAVFMIFYYQKAGSIAALSLTFTILFILGILAGFEATLTLPGIAGIVLTIGMAVDANVLIFERIREEEAMGKTLRASVEGGFAKAYSAIWDSNITTFFTGIILYQFGTGPIQGFALTLMIGIASSLFSALVISKVIFDIMVKKGNKISIG